MKSTFKMPQQPIVQFAAIIGLTVCAVLMILYHPWMLFFAAAIVGAVYLAYYVYYLPNSELSELRKVHPAAREVIDEQEKQFAKDRAAIIGRTAQAKSELAALVE